MFNITKEILYEEVDKVRNMLLSIGLKEPFNPYEICSKFDDLEIADMPFKTPRLRGVVNLGNKEEPTCIILNSNLSSFERNFYGCHELMHARFETGEGSTSFRCYDKTMPFQDSYIEWKANEGAAELLVPYKRFIPDFCEFFKLYMFEFQEWLVTYDSYDIYDALSDKYHVTQRVIKNRVSNLSYEIDQYLEGCSIENITILSRNQQIKNNIVPTNYIELIQSLLCNYDFVLSYRNIV